MGEGGGGPDKGLIAKMPHQNHVGSMGTKWKENRRNWVEVEAVMEGIFIEMHGSAKWQGNAKLK